MRVEVKKLSQFLHNIRVIKSRNLLSRFPVKLAYRARELKIRDQVVHPLFKHRNENSTY